MASASFPFGMDIARTRPFKGNDIFDSATGRQPGGLQDSSRGSSPDVIGTIPPEQ